MRSQTLNSGFKIAIPVSLFWALLAGTSIHGVSAQSPAQPPASGGQAATQASSASAAPSSGEAAPLSKTDLLALLYKVYDQAYHFGDAVAKLPAGDWKFGGRKREIFYEKAYAVRASVTAFGKPWDEFYKHPDDAALGRKTLSALHAVTTQMNDFMAALADTPGASQVADFKPMANAVEDAEHQLDPYVTYLQASAKAPESAATAAASASTPPAVSTAPAQPSAPQNKPAEHTETSPAAPSSNAASTPPPPPAAEAAAPPSPSAAPAAAPANPAVTPVAMPAADVQALLYKIYEATFRLGDLAGSLETDKWNLSSQDQAGFTAKLDALRAALATAEKSRSDFYSHPDDAGLAQTTASDLQAVTPKLDDFVAALSGTPAAGSASEFKKTGDDLTALDEHLEPYVAYLAAKSQPPSAAGVETENITTPENVAPLASGIVEAAPADEQQVKDILYKAYVPAFRLKDMLAQEHPDQWHASQADRAAFDDASKTLSDRIAELQKWRDQLDSHPDSLEAAFETYAALGKLVGPADAVGRIVGQYGNATIGAEYGQRAEQVGESRDQLEPYLDYLLRHYDHTSGSIERDFVACENQLNFAMRPEVHQAVAMKNVNPVFQGRGRRAARSSHPENKKKTSADEKNKKAAASDKSKKPPAPASH